MTEQPPVNPHRITIALDRAGLFGPTADAKLDAHRRGCQTLVQMHGEPENAPQGALFEQPT